MAYKEPGTRITVKEDESLIVTAGGLRIPAFIGEGITTKEVTEASVSGDGTTYGEIGVLSVPEGIMASSTYLSDGELSPGTYEFVVTALNDEGETTESNSISVTTVSGFTNAAIVSWNSVVGAESYRVYEISGSSPYQYYKVSGPNPATRITIRTETGDGTSALPVENNASIMGYSRSDVLSSQGIQEIIKVYSNTNPQYNSLYYSLGVGTIIWRAKDQSNIPLDNQVYSVDLKINKTTSDYYVPTLMSSYSQMVQAFGVPSEANSLSLAGQLAFEYGTSIIMFVQVDPSDFSGSSKYNAYKKGLAALESVKADIICPLMNNSNGDLATFISSELLSHIANMSNPNTSRWRVAIAGIDNKSSTAFSDNSYNLLVNLAKGLSYERIAIPTCGKVRKVLSTGEVELPGTFCAAQIAGMSCNSGWDSATPLTNKRFNGFTWMESINEIGTKRYLASNGLMVIDQSGSAYRIMHQLTTNMTTASSQEFSVVTSIDEVLYQLKSSLDSIFVGNKLLSTTPLSVKASTEKILESFQQEEKISGFSNIITEVGSDPRTMKVSGKVRPMFPCNEIDFEMLLTASI